MTEIKTRLAEATQLSLRGLYDSARAIYLSLLNFELKPGLRARIENDLATIAAVKGHGWAFRSHISRAAEHGDSEELIHHNFNLLKGNTHSQDSRVKVAILSLLFNWPSTGGGTVHTKELADFLDRDGYDVRHVYAVNESFGVGRVTEPLGDNNLPLEFSESEWNANSLRRRFQAAVREFDPDWVIITDSWSTKPLLAEAVCGYPYFLRIAALECLCPLNNVRMLFGPGTDSSPQPEIVQCSLNQLSEPQSCRDCVLQNANLSNGIHRAERLLARFDHLEYPHRLKQAFARSEGILAVNPGIAALAAPHTPAAHVIPSGFDPLRFPADFQPPPVGDNRNTRLLFAGLRDELMKGFYVLQAAAAQLWDHRQDFELWVTGDPHEGDPEYLKAIGWQSQQQLTEVICTTDLLVFPTVAQEALGRSAVEAMGCGRPVLASRLGGLAWVVEHERTGLLFDPGDVDDLCLQIERLLDDRELRERLGRAGQQKFQREFTWESILEKNYRPLFGPAHKHEESQPMGAAE